MKHLWLAMACIAVSSLAAGAPRPARADDDASILANLPVPPTLSVSTIPPNGDVNPYGVAFVPRGFPGGGALHTGDILVSNFNSSANLQGTGTTIVRVARNGTTSVFFQGPSGLGLTTALGVLRSGFVLVGNLPATYDSSGNLLSIGQGSLLILDRRGNLVTTLSNAALLDGPWDLTIDDDGGSAQVFVSNVLSGGVTRLTLRVTRQGVTLTNATQIASGYAHRPDPDALVIGPTGLAYDEERDLLYVASTGDNAIFAVPHAERRMTDAGMGHLVYQDNAHLRGPLGLVLAPNGHLITTNGDAVNGDPTQPSEMVEFTPQGQFVAQTPVNNTGQGGAFGIAIAGTERRVILAAVDDVANALDVWDVTLPDKD